MERCKHCKLQIVPASSGWTHIEGMQEGKHTCAINPYGFVAAPHGEACDFTCRGHDPGLRSIS